MCNSVPAKNIAELIATAKHSLKSQHRTDVLFDVIFTLEEVKNYSILRRAQSLAPGNEKANQPCASFML